MSSPLDMYARLEAADALPQFTAIRRRTYELLRPYRGKVLDLGCGTGRAVAELIEDGADAVGLDPDEGALAIARERRPGLDIRHGTADALPYADGELGGYRADKVLHLVPDPAGAVDEARRVLRPGGRIVLSGHDWDGVMIDADDGDLTRRLVQTRADTIPHPRIPRRFRTLLVDAGFADPQLETHMAIFTGPEALPMLASYDTDGWLDEQRRRAAAGRMTVAVPFFVASATVVRTG
jgi:SAM-dependent methyltransferase